MKKIILSIVSCMVCLGAWAYDFCVDDIFYNILSDNSVEVTHDINAENSVNGTYKGRVTIPENVTHEGTTYNVTAIGENAFTECDRLTNVTLPESITAIGRKAFYDCSRLKEITLPEAVTSIGELAFYHCVTLKTINLPASVASIGSKAFMLCGGLTSLTVDASNAQYCSEKNIIYNKDKTLLVAAMPTISGSITLPTTVTEIGDNAFVECDALTAIDLKNVEVIRDFAFFDCKGLTTVTLPESLKELGLGAFFNCTNLTTLKMNSSLEVVGERAFMRCSALKTVEFAGKNLKIGSHAFEACKNLTIDENATCISEIGDYAFASCIKHRSTVLPANVKRIGEKAFFACPQISRLTLGNRLEEIGENAFLGCNRIRQITINAMTPPAICQSTFAEVVYEQATLAVPDESIDDYKAAEHWKAFMEITPSALTNIDSDSNLRIIVGNGHLCVEGATAEATVAVYATNGVLVQRTTVAQLAQCTFESGIYIVMVEKRAYKVVI